MATLSAKAAANHGACASNAAQRQRGGVAAAASWRRRIKLACGNGGYEIWQLA